MALADIITRLSGFCKFESARKLFKRRDDSFSPHLPFSWLLQWPFGVLLFRTFHELKLPST